MAEMDLPQLLSVYCFDGDEDGVVIEWRRCAGGSCCGGVSQCQSNLKRATSWYFE